MKYLKLFDTHSQYTAFIQTEDFIVPNISYCKDRIDDVYYNPAIFLFLSKEKKIVSIPYINGLTSQSFADKTPSSDWYFGFIKTPIDYSQTIGKTNDEIDALFAEYKRTNMALSQPDFKSGKIYKVITFGKEYMSEVIINTIDNNGYFIFCVPTHMIRNCGLILNETQKTGSMVSQFNIVDKTTGTTIRTITSQDFNLDGRLCIVQATLEQGIEYIIKPYYTTYDNIIVEGDVIKTFTA